MRNFLSLLLCIFFIGGCASTTSKPVPTQRWFETDFSEVNIPARAGQFTSGGSTSFGDTRMGFVVRYASPEFIDALVDVYVYPVDLPEGYSLADMNEIELGNTVSQLMLYPAAQLHDVAIFSPTQSISALKARMSLTIEKKMMSYVYLAMRDDVYIKVRFSVPVEKPAEKIADEFTEQLLAQLTFVNPEAHQHGFGTTLAFTAADMNLDNPTKMLLMMLHATALQQEIAAGHYVDSPERALRVWSSILVNLDDQDESETNNPTDPALQGIVSAYNAGFLKEYIWTYFKRPYWKASADLRMNEFVTWSAKDAATHTPYIKLGTLITWGNGEKK